jgi:hypothetical protein
MKQLLMPPLSAWLLELFDSTLQHLVLSDWIVLVYCIIEYRVESHLPLDILSTPTDSLLSCSELESLPVMIHGPLFPCLENCSSQQQSLGSTKLPSNH